MLLRLFSHRSSSGSRIGPSALRLNLKPFKKSHSTHSIPYLSLAMVPYEAEKQFAMAAVRRACLITSSVFDTLVKWSNDKRDEGIKQVKEDKSPVTVADYAAQALISTMLLRAFPDDPIVGEEDASSLRSDSNSELRDKIIALANDALTAPLFPSDKPAWGIGPEPSNKQSTVQLLDAIDRGNFEGGRKGRMWTIDPIDGTKGFLRGEQYAVCLSLIEDSEVKVGVIGCPNLPVHPRTEERKGCLFVAVKGQGAEQISLDGSDANPLSISQSSSTDPSSEPDLSNLVFLESVDPSHSSHSTNDIVSSILGVKAQPIRMDSQAKYCVLARGLADENSEVAYLRLPTGVGYKEKIWDHAPGSLLVTECGGIVTDSRGRPLDFGLGRTLGENYGVIGTRARCSGTTGEKVHLAVLNAVQEALVKVRANA